MIYAFDDCQLDSGLFELRRAGDPVAIEPQVFEVLRYLVMNAGRMVTRQELTEHVWHGSFISPAALDNRVMAARRAIGDSGSDQQRIRTVRGRGYRFLGEITVLDEAPAAPAAPTKFKPSGTSAQRIQFCTTTDGVRIAYATSGHGPPLVKAANWLTHLEFDWASPAWRHWLAFLSRGQLLVRYDERGCGLSDREIDDFSLEAWVSDLEAVVDAAGMEKFPLLGLSQGGPIAIAYTARHPERVSQLALCGTYARGWARRNPSPAQIEERTAILTLTREGWGRDNPAYRQIFASTFIPGATREQEDWFNELCRISTSSENAVRFLQEFGELDVEHLLPQIGVPTLVLHARDDARVPFEWGRSVAAEIPGARFVPLDSQNHILLEDEPAWQTFMSELTSFLAR